MDNNKSKVLFSLLAGAAAGVVAGLLLAPDSGKKSRESLMNSASKWGDDLDKIFRDGLGRLQEMTGNLGSMASKAASAAKSSADDMFNDFSSENSGGASASSGSGRKSSGGSSTSASSSAGGTGSMGTSVSDQGARSNPGTSPS